MAGKQKPDRERATAGETEETEEAEGTGEDAQLPGDPEQLKALLQESREEAKRHLDGWKRAAADFANYRRRQEAEREELATYAKTGLIGRLLAILDDFERALHNLPPSLAHLTWTEGIFLIERKLRAILEAEGVEPIEAQGKPFDPNVHQAVLYEPSPEVPEGQVIGELQRGYTLNGRVLRPSMVRVSRGTEPDAAEPPSGGSEQPDHQKKEE